MSEPKPYCGEDCALIKRMEHDMAEIIGVIKKMEKACNVAKTVIIGLMDENMKLTDEIRRQATRRN